MKKLGLIGGTGPESTVPYYHGIVYGVQKKVGPTFFPNLTIESVNVFDVLDLCSREDYDGVTEYLMRAVSSLTAAGADFVALSANTAHIVFDRLQERSPVPMLSIIETTCQEAKRQGLTRLGLLGTIFTMEKDFFKEPFERAGIEVVLPTAEERQYIHEKISRELEMGIVTEETRRGFCRILDRMEREDGIQAAILGCTELPMLFRDVPAPMPVLDTMAIHIQALVDEIVK